MRTLRTLPTGQDPHELLTRKPSALTWSELVALTSVHQTRQAIADGRIVRLLPNAYVAAEHADSFEARADAALMWAGEDVALSGRSALAQWTLVEPPDVIDLLVPQSWSLRTPAWLRAHRLTTDPPIAHVNGRPAVTVDHALAQGFGHLPASEQGDVVFAAIRHGTTTTAAIRDALAVSPRVKGRRRLLSRVAAAEAGAESWLEAHSLTDVFHQKEFDRFIRQHRVRCEDRLYRLDMFDAPTRTAIELDGGTWHGTPAQRRDDVRRDADLATLGIQTIRLTYWDLTERPEWCRNVVRGVLAARESH